MSKPIKKPTTSEELMVALLLVDIEIPIEVLDTWSRECREEVYKWAGLSYLKASDNNVGVPSKPLIISNYEYK